MTGCFLIFRIACIIGSIRKPNLRRSHYLQFGRCGKQGIDTYLKIKNLHSFLCAKKILACFLEYFKENNPKRVLSLILTHLDDLTSLDFFDEAEKDSICGSSMVLKIKRDHIINMRMGVGLGTNTKAKLLTLCRILWSSH